MTFLSLQIRVEARAQDLIYVPTSQVKRGSPRKRGSVEKKREKRNGINRETQLRKTRDEVHPAE